jgi:hypothetical protein
MRALGAGIASRYHWCHWPDLSPATSSTALRAGSKMNKIRTSAKFRKGPEAALIADPQVVTAG